MEIRYIPIEKLRRDPDRLFPHPSKEEYEDLKQSIMKFGILDPLLVTSDGNGFYLIIAGERRLTAAEDIIADHRGLTVAEDIKLKGLPCIEIDKMEIEGGLDTEIFRRHLTPEERIKYKSLKEQRCREIIEKELGKKLLPAFLDEYKKGALPLRTAIYLAKLDVEGQSKLLEVGSGSGLDSEEADYKASLLKKEEELNKKKLELEGLKKWKAEKEEEIQDKIEEFEEKKSKVSDTVKKEFQQQIDDKEKVNEALRRQIREKEAQIETLKEELQKPAKREFVERVNEKAKKILDESAKRKYMVNVILVHIDAAIEEIKKGRARMKDDILLSKKDASVARQRINKLIDDSRELLRLIKEEK